MEDEKEFVKILPSSQIIVDHEIVEPARPIIVRCEEKPRKPVGLEEEKEKPIELTQEELKERSFELMKQCGIKPHDPDAVFNILLFAYQKFGTCDLEDFKHPQGDVNYDCNVVSSMCSDLVVTPRQKVKYFMKRYGREMNIIFKRLQVTTDD